MLRDANILSVFLSTSFSDISLSFALFCSISQSVIQLFNLSLLSVLLFRLVRRFRLINLLLFGGIDQQLFYMDLPHVKWNYALFMINRSQTLRLSNSLCSRYLLFKRIFHASEAFLLKVRKKNSDSNPSTEDKIEYCHWAVSNKEEFK